MAAALAGAAGMGLETVLLAAGGLAMGPSRAAALGLGGFVAGWALGAWLAGRHGRSTRAWLAASGALVLLLAWVGPLGLFTLAAHAPSALVATGGAWALIALSALPQGAFLPLLLRSAAAHPGSAAGILPRMWGLNLLGSTVGAWCLGHVVVGWAGFQAAALLAGGLAAMAAAIGWAVTSDSCTGEPAAASSQAPRLSLPRAGWILGWGTLWAVGLQWLCLRLALLWVDVAQTMLALSLVLASGLLSLSAGALLLPRLLLRDERGVLQGLALALAGSTWPLCAGPALARAHVHGTWAVALTLVAPTTFAVGALVPLLHRCVAGESGRRLGGLLLHEAWGALLAGPLVHWVLVPHVGVGGSLALLALIPALAAWAVRGHRRWKLALCAACLTAAFLAGRAREPALASPKLNDPALSVRAFREDGAFAVTVVDDGLQGERTLLTDQFRAAGTGREYAYMRVLGHLPLLLHPTPREVAVLALGTGTTLGAVARHPAPLPERIDVLEISAAVVDLARHFEAVNGGVLSSAPDARVRVLLGDGRRTLAERPGAYDVITMEPLLPDSPFGVYLYTREFYGIALRALRPRGLLCQWVPPHALEPEVFEAVLGAFRQACPWSSVWLAGTQVVLIGGEQAPALDPLRFPAPGTPLHAALAPLGLTRPETVAARFVLAGPPPAGAPSLGDRHPWIVYRPKPSGLRVLEFLPDNLERLLSWSTPLPELWTAALGPDSVAHLEAHAALRRARILQGRADLAARTGAVASVELARAVAAELRPALGVQPPDPEVQEFAREVDFVAALRQGTAALLAGDAARALDPLSRSAALRPERADVHLYLGAALHMLGEGAAARAALAKALELAPRALETAPGRRVGHLLPAR